jgi:hypothetical protein
MSLRHLRHILGLAPEVQFRYGLERIFGGLFPLGGWVIAPGDIAEVFFSSRRAS